MFEIEINSETYNKYEYEYRMVEENNIPSFLTLRLRHEDSDETLVYDTTSMTSLSDLAVRKPLTYMELCMLIDSLHTARCSVREYLLTFKGIILTPEKIFYDSFERHIRFVYNPANESDEFSSYTELTEFLLTAVDYTDEEAVKLAYELYAAVLNKDYEFEKYADMTKYKNYMDKIKLKSLRAERQFETKVHTEPTSSEPILKTAAESNVKPVRLTYFSVVCLTLFIVSSMLIGFIYLFNQATFSILFGNSKYLTSFVLIMALLLYFPVMNISDIKRSRRK